MQVQELVGIVPWTFIAQICNLFLQMYLIKRFLFKPVNEVKNEIGGMAMEIAGKVIEREIKEEDHAKLIDEFISNVGEAS